MSTIAEKLQTLHDTKVAIKAAIENKGQDLTDVPFTEYAERIAAIENGGETERSLKKLLDASKTVASMFAQNSSVTDIKSLFEYDDTEYVTNFERFCYYASNILEVPWFNTEKATNFIAIYRGCSKITYIPLYVTENVTTVREAFYQCAKIKTIAELDCRNVTDFHSAFWAMGLLEEIWIKNIQADLQVGSGTSYGHLIKQECAIHLLYELRDTGSAKTITFSKKTGELLANVYVKSILITDEMRAEDDLVDEKLPFVVCESTDEGATLITEYVLQKNWQVALA